MIYLSLVGTQVMAVLNPLLALMERNEKPDRVELLATEKSFDNAGKIKQFLIDSKSYCAENITVTEISDNLVQDEKGRLPAHEVIREKTSDLKCFSFNIAGGMNFQIAACIYEINPEYCLLYPESKGIYSIKVGSERIEQDIYGLPETVNVLKLQGVKFSQRTGMKQHKLLTDTMKFCNVKLPANTMRHIQIGNVVFDAVWNTGNELKFIKVIHSSKSSNNKADSYLAEARNMMGLAIRREQFGELYHRQIAILTNHPLIAERVKSEGSGKIVILNKAVGTFREDARNYFERRQTNKVKSAITSEYTGNPKSGGPVLYVPLGENITPSLIALWSHRPETVNFLYTPDDPVIRRYKDAILEHKKLFPVEKISFYPVSIIGHEILEIQAPYGQKTEVNITPGTKGHAAFLSLWANVHSADIYSIETKSQRLEQIPMGDKKPLQAPNPVTYLKSKGESLKSEGENKESILNNRGLFQGILNFIEEAHKEGKAISDFPTKPISLSEMIFNIKNNLAKISFNDTKKTLQWSLKNNVWFESLIGFVLAECGADDVQIRVRTRWSPETEKYLEERYNMSSHKTDLDVVARFKTDYYVVSCKSGKKEGVGKIATEASAFASLFGRFAVPLVAFLQYSGEPYSHNDNGPYIFGYKTFIDIEDMKKLVKKAVAEKRKTWTP